MKTPQHAPQSSVHHHIERSLSAIHTLSTHAPVLVAWSQTLATCLSNGGRLLVAGNGGSAAEAQHLTAELVGRYRTDRRAFSAIALHAESSSITAIGNDYGYDQVFARQVEAHAQPGDIVLLLSTSGVSANLLKAAQAARLAGARCWAMTGPAPNPLARAVDQALCIDAPSCHVQEGHLVAVHALCECFDTAVEATIAPALTLSSKRAV